MHGRRAFLRTAMAVGAAAWTVGRARPPAKGKTMGSRIIKPKRLAKGDKVGLIAPASNTWENEDTRFAIDILASLGFRVAEGAHLYDRRGYLAGADRDRAADLNRMFADPEIKGVFALRGGYGSMRILPYLDYETIAANPKPFVGYSDITALHIAIHERTGLIAFSGPIAAQTFTDYTLAEFKKVLMEPQAPTVIAAPPPFEGGEGKVERENRLTRLVPGKARGRLTGGSLTLLASLMGTPFEPSFDGKILVLEDVGERPYRVDRMLTQLWLSGKLDRLAGLVFGKFTDADPSGGRSLSLEEIFTERARSLGKPAIRGLMIGHVDDQTTLPIGAEAELDADAGTLTLLETAVA